MTKILSEKPTKKFRCPHCETRFITDQWRKTRRGYSADCQRCPYATWTPR